MTNELLCEMLPIKLIASMQLRELCLLCLHVSRLQILCDPELNLWNVLMRNMDF